MGHTVLDLGISQGVSMIEKDIPKQYCPIHDGYLLPCKRCNKSSWETSEEREKQIAQLKVQNKKLKFIKDTKLLELKEVVKTQEQERICKEIKEFWEEKKEGMSIKQYCITRDFVEELILKLKEVKKEDLDE